MPKFTKSKFKLWVYLTFVLFVMPTSVRNNYIVKKNKEIRSNIYIWILSTTKLVFSKLLLKYFEIRFLQKIETTSYAIFA